MTIEIVRNRIQALRNATQATLNESYTDEQRRLIGAMNAYDDILKELEEPEPASDGWTVCTPKDIEQDKPRRKRVSKSAPATGNKVNPNIEYPTCPKCLSTRVLMSGIGGIRYCADCDTKNIWSAVEVPPGFLEAVGDAPEPEKSAVVPKVPECSHRDPKTNMCDDKLPCKAAWRNCPNYASIGAPLKTAPDPALTAKGEVLLCPNCRSPLTYPSVESDGEFWCGECDGYVPVGMEPYAITVDRSAWHVYRLHTPMP